MVKGGCKVNGMIKGLKFLNGSNHWFLVLTENGELSGFLFREKEVFI